MNVVYTKKERMKLGLLGMLLHFLMVTTMISCGFDPLVMVGKLIWHDVAFSMLFFMWTGSCLIVMVCMICNINSRLPHTASLVLFVVLLAFTTMTGAKDTELVSTLSDKIVLGSAFLCWIGNPWIIWYDSMS